MLWFSISTCEGFGRGVEFVCDCWVAPGPNECYFFMRPLLYRCYPWVPPSATLRDALCSDRAGAVRLLRIYSWFSVLEGDFRALCDLIMKHYDELGAEEVLWCLRDRRLSFNEISGRWVYIAASQPREARAYLIGAREFIGTMEGFLRAKGGLSPSALDELRAIREQIDLREGRLQHPHREFNPVEKQGSAVHALRERVSPFGK